MWEDITDIIHAAASALKDAAYAKIPMLAVEDFSLFEAMSATELFDEKMDPGTALHCTPLLHSYLRLSSSSSSSSFSFLVHVLPLQYISFSSFFFVPVWSIGYLI